MGSAHNGIIVAYHGVLEVFVGMDILFLRNGGHFGNVNLSIAGQ